MLTAHVQAKLDRAKARAEQAEDAEFLAGVEVDKERRAREGDQAARVAAEQKARVATMVGSLWPSSFLPNARCTAGTSKQRQQWWQIKSQAKQLRAPMSSL